MFKPSFFAGALLGFAFANSKQGQRLKVEIESIVSQNTEKIEHAKADLGKAKAKILQLVSGGAGKTETQEKEMAEKEMPEMASGNYVDMFSDDALDIEKAQELADKLGAKPAAPADETMAPFQNHNDHDQRKSA
jgi:hypothetical protein